MTSLLPDSSRRPHRPAPGRPPAVSPLVPTALLGGVAAASATLVICLAVAVIGWFATDAGIHGEPRDALRVGALAWLAAHGSGVHIGTVPVTLLPLGISLLAAWSTWRAGHRVGVAVAGHGPDAQALGDGERDWTVPVAAGFLALGYGAVALLTVVLSAPGSGEQIGPDQRGVLLWTVLLCGGLGLPGVAVGSGRAALWAMRLPWAVVDAVDVAGRLLRVWAWLCLLVFVAALLADLGTAANLLGQLHARGGGATTFTLAETLLLPNVLACTGAYLLGPGFSVGVGTVVSPAFTSVGALPLLPMLAALPNPGEGGASRAVVLVPPLLAAWVGFRSQRRRPLRSFVDVAVRATLGGVLAGLAFGVLASVAGGAAGPGRMRNVGPVGLDVLVSGVVSFGFGALLGALVCAAWQQHRERAALLAGHAGHDDPDAPLVLARESDRRGSQHPAADGEASAPDGAPGRGGVAGRLRGLGSRLPRIRG